MKEPKEYKTSWLTWYPTFGFLNFKFSVAGYFDQRPEIVTHTTTIIGLLGLLFTLPFGWHPIILLWLLFIGIPFGQTFIHIPYKTGIEECEPPTYGFYLYGEQTRIFNSFWLCLGNKNKCYRMPWDLEWVRKSMQKKDGTWEHEVKGQKKDFYLEKWQGILWEATYLYLYTLKSGEVQERNATVQVCEMEWRPRWFKWTSIFSKVSRYIDIKFDDEVGERTGSWKGGTVACSWELKPNETSLESLKRMEKERTF